MYVYTHIYIYIYIRRAACARGGPSPPAAARACARSPWPLGAKDCTPEIDLSEIIVDFQRHFSINCRVLVPYGLELRAVDSSRRRNRHLHHRISRTALESGCVKPPKS